MVPIQPSSLLWSEWLVREALPPSSSWGNASHQHGVSTNMERWTLCQDVTVLAANFIMLQYIQIPQNEQELKFLNWKKKKACINKSPFIVTGPAAFLQSQSDSSQVELRQNKKPSKAQPRAVTFIPTCLHDRNSLLVISRMPLLLGWPQKSDNKKKIKLSFQISK